MKKLLSTTLCFLTIFSLMIPTFALSNKSTNINKTFKPEMEMILDEQRQIAEHMNNLSNEFFPTQSRNKSIMDADYSIMSTPMYEYRSVHINTHVTDLVWLGPVGGQNEGGIMQVHGGYLAYKPGGYDTNVPISFSVGYQFFYIGISTPLGKYDATVSSGHVNPYPGEYVKLHIGKQFRVQTYKRQRRLVMGGNGQWEDFGELFHTTTVFSEAFEVRKVN